jgi:hypothetical protein
MTSSLSLATAQSDAHRSELITTIGDTIHQNMVEFFPLVCWNFKGSAGHPAPRGDGDAETMPPAGVRLQHWSFTC